MPIIKRELRINSKISMRDGNFGIWLNLKKHLPTGCDAVLVYVMKTGKKEHKRVCLPHQVYYEDIIEQTENMKYPMFFEPHYPKYKPFMIVGNDSIQKELDDHSAYEDK